MLSCMISSFYTCIRNGGFTFEKTTTKDLAEKLRSPYIKNSPEGMSAHNIKLMSDNDLLDMDYFFHKFDDDDFGEEGFYLF